MKENRMRRTMIGVVGVMFVAGLVAAQEATPAPAPAPAPAAEPPAPAAKPAVATPPANMVASMKIICAGKVKTSGEAGLLFSDGSAPKEIRVTLQKGMNKSEVCRDIEKELSVMLGANYGVDNYDDDKVKVEGKKGATFSLTLGAQSATGITLELKQ